MGGSESNVTMLSGKTCRQIAASGTFHVRWLQKSTTVQLESVEHFSSIALPKNGAGLVVQSVMEIQTHSSDVKALQKIQVKVLKTVRRWSYRSHLTYMCEAL